MGTTRAIKNLMEKQKQWAVIRLVMNGEIMPIREWAHRWGLAIPADGRTVKIETCRMALEMDLPEEVQERARGILKAAGVRLSWRNAKRKEGEE